MAVNGIEIEVAQVWRTRGGEEVTIRSIDDHATYPVNAEYESRGSRRIRSYSQTGERDVHQPGSDRDLVELVSPAAKPEPDADDWTTWAGGDNPVPGSTVRLVLRNGGERTAAANDLCWPHAGNEGDIVKYRVVEAAKPGLSEFEEAERAAGRLDTLASLFDKAARGEPPLNAIAILDKAAGHMRDRAATYDSPEGERSMGAAVTAFNAITKQTLTEAEGWLLLQVLKDVRLFQRSAFHQDSAEDCVAYAALKAEAKAKGGAQ